MKEDVEHLTKINYLLTRRNEYLQDLLWGIRKYLEEFFSSQKELEKEKEKQKNIENWETILKIVKEDIDKAYIYIDYSSNKENISAKKQYIKQMKKNACISTDKLKFINLFSEFQS